MFKRIYATVTEKEFNIFREKCYSNVVKIGDCLAQLVRDYIEINKEIHEIQHHKPTGIDYKNEKV